jgi:hypothetical protein
MNDDDDDFNNAKIHKIIRMYVSSYILKIFAFLKSSFSLASYIFIFT